MKPNNKMQMIMIKMIIWKLMKMILFIKNNQKAQKISNNNKKSVKIKIIMMICLEFKMKIKVMNSWLSSLGLEL